MHPGTCVSAAPARGTPYISPRPRTSETNQGNAMSSNRSSSSGIDETPVDSSTIPMPPFRVSPPQNLEDLWTMNEVPHPRLPTQHTKMPLQEE